MLALATKRVVDRHHTPGLIMHPGEPSQMADHFTPADRRELTTTSVKLDGLKEDFAELKRMLTDSTTGIRTSMDNDARDHQLLHEKLDGRLRALENFRWWIVGAAAASGATFGYLSRFFHP